MHYLGICAILKDETPFVEEWVAYHTLLGVERFFLYDNASAVPLSDTLSRHLSPNYLDVHPVPGPAGQLPCYNHCLHTYAKECRWIAFIDADEFLVPHQVQDLRLMLNEFESYAGFAPHWKMFGSSGYNTRPPGLQIENYCMALSPDHPHNAHVKLIVKPERVFRFLNPHRCQWRHANDTAVDEGHRPVTTATPTPVTWDTCQLNHYYYRSKQDYYLKQCRGRADSGTKYTIPTRVDIPHGECEDRAAAAYAPLVRTLLEHQEGRSWERAIQSPIR